jgi:hypothetical protein
MNDSFTKPSCNMDLVFATDASPRIDIAGLVNVVDPSIPIPRNLHSMGNCCWANVWIMVLMALNRKMNASDSQKFINMIILRKSERGEVADLSAIIENTRIPYTIFVYCNIVKRGWNLTKMGLPIIAFVHTGGHYQIWLPRGSLITKPFYKFQVDFLEERRLEREKPAKENCMIDERKASANQIFAKSSLAAQPQQETYGSEFDDLSSQMAAVNLICADKDALDLRNRKLQMESDERVALDLINRELRMESDDRRCAELMQMEYDAEFVQMEYDGNYARELGLRG